jgi:cellulose synthase/poly-beta-1,6-N-acetylglucosamine synthase-like glycosyltransferase
MVDEAMEYFRQAIQSGTEGAKGTGKLAGGGMDGSVGEGQRGGVRLEDGVEIIVVDDGSSDGTAGVARELSAKWASVKGVEIRVVRLEENRGKGGAVQHVRPIFDSLVLSGTSTCGVYRGVLRGVLRCG